MPAVAMGGPSLAGKQKPSEGIWERLFYKGKRDPTLDYDEAVCQVSAQSERPRCSH